MAWRVDMVFCDQNKCYIRVGQLFNYQIYGQKYRSHIREIQMRARFGEGEIRLPIIEPVFFTDLHGELEINPDQITIVDGVKFIHEEQQP